MVNFRDKLFFSFKPSEFPVKLPSQQCSVYNTHAGIHNATYPVLVTACLFLAMKDVVP